jgi:GH24 family phage-related lysozyme (muramidase)
MSTDEKMKTQQMQGVKNMDIERNSKMEKNWDSLAQRNFILKKDIAEQNFKSNVLKKYTQPNKQIKTPELPVSTEYADTLNALVHVTKNIYGSNNVIKLNNGLKIYNNNIQLTPENYLIINGNKIKPKKMATIRSGNKIIKFPHYDYLKYRIKRQETTNIKNNNYKDPMQMQVSSEFWNEMKIFEGLSGSGEPALISYNIGDGKKTIGWGHTGPVRGQEQIVKQTQITKQEAEQLLIEDVNKAVNCVKNIFRNWKNEDMNRKPDLITQNMFDVLVSLVFNSGCGTLNRSSLIKYIKARRYREGAELIKNYSINSKFAKGLLKRRQKEYNKFLS